MQPGDLIAGRFIIERVAGRGGMGTVFRALDTVLGKPVALKVLDAGPEGMAERFLREARVLAEIDHPVVVRYVGQGAQGAALWLAMEWLEGVDLAQMLARAPLGVRATISLAVRVAEGLAAAHAVHVVHRDIKPSNLVLVEGDPSRVRLIDFGVARVGGRTQRLTGTGQFVGTAGYMAPEQIAQAAEIDERVDVFALGCVIYECLTGRAAFPGDSVIAVLAKVLKDEPPRPSDLEPRTPPGLDALVLSMLSKDRDKRPANAAAVVELLRLVEESGDAAALTMPRPRTSVTGREQRLVSAILLQTETDARLPPEALRRAAEVGAERTDLGEGAHLFILGQAGAAGDQAARAAACALALRAVLPGSAIALGTGLADAGGGGVGLPVGPAIDRCAMLLHGPAARGAGVAIDEVTEGLLGDRFEIAGDGAQRAIFAGRVEGRPGRILARATPFVGREKELVMLEAVLTETVSEPISRSVLVVGAPGAGKSRLLREFLAKVSERRAARVLSARASLVGAGSPLSLARQLVRRAADVHEGDATEAVAERLDDYLATRFDGPSFGRARAFLGELVGAPAGGEPSPELVAARNEPRVLAEWLRRTFIDWLKRESIVGPLVIVLDDLQWGDVPTVAWIGEALRAHPEVPVLVLALARPEVFENVADVRGLLEPQEIRLGGLTRRAAEQLVRAVLGQDASNEAVSRVVERAEGNPFFLEELVRRVTEDRSDATPETVLAVVQSRYGKLDVEVRRALRAGSVFGRTFWAEAVEVLVGASNRNQVDEWIAVLERHEIVERAPGEKFPTFAAWSFRHDLLRDAAYAMLTPDDLATAHKRAVEWLERAGERDAVVLADHYERAREPGQAAMWLARAAEVAVDAASFPEALALAGRALALGVPTDAQRGSLHVVESVSAAFLHDWGRARAAALSAVAEVAPGTAPWFRAMGVLGFAAASFADSDALDRQIGALRAMKLDPEPTGAYGFALFALVTSLGLTGRRDVAEELLARAEKDASYPDFGFVAWRCIARAHMALFAKASPAPAIRYIDEARRFAPGLDAVFRLVSTYFFAAARLEIGDAPAAEHAAQTLLGERGSRAIPYVVDWATHAVARCAMMTRRFDEAAALAERLRQSPDALIRQRGGSLLAQIHLLAGRFEEAVAMADEVCRGPLAPHDTVAALFVRARVAIERGRLDVARADLFQAQDILGWAGASPNLASASRNVEIEVLRASGDDAFRGRLAEARARVLRVADTLSDPALRHAWLERAYENARTLALANEVLGEVGDETESPTVGAAPFEDEPTVAGDSWADEPTNADAYGIVDDATVDVRLIDPSQLDPRLRDPSKGK